MAASLILFSRPLRVLKFHYLQVLLCFILGFLCETSKSHSEEVEDILLCKYCGTDVADLNYYESIKSPASLRTVNQSFSGKQFVVQTLKNPSNFYFDVITVKKSNCIGYGEWSRADSWFPGYAWKVCVCQPWGHFLGWLFEPLEKIQKDQRKASNKGFYALITSNVLTEQFSNSLLIVPKSFSS